MERIFITGANGFIGSELTKKLSGEYEVFGLIRTTSNRHALDSLKDSLERIEIRYGNLTDYAAIKKMMRDISPHFIIHLGAATAVRHSFENPLEFQETNHQATANLVHTALDIPDFKKFLFASTMEVYGWQEGKTPLPEETPLHPESPYAVSKVAAEEYIKMAGEAYGLPYLISRACNTFGRKDNTGFIVEYIITNMLKEKTVYLGTPHAVRDMMYVDDHVNAYITSLKSSIKKGVFNFGTGSMTSMKDLAEKISTLIGFNGKIIHNFPPGYPSRPVVSPFLSLDSTKAKKALGWEPAIPLEEGLKKTIDFWRKT